VRPTSARRRPGLRYRRQAWRLKRVLPQTQVTLAGKADRAVALLQEIAGAQGGRTLGLQIKRPWPARRRPLGNCAATLPASSC